MTPTPLTLAAEQVARGLRAACIAELRAFKPGNVSSTAPGHSMTARDFVVSARAAAPALTAPAAAAGERILRAVQATRAAVACNTNLGILLLCAPLAHAVLTPRDSDSLQQRLDEVLAMLDHRDAELTYRAIRVAAPGGLGTAPEHDVREQPHATLRQAMQTAAPWDRIAFQYTHGYPDIFRLGLPHLRREIARLGGLRWALVSLYLTFLSRFPDTHVARRHGLHVAGEVSRRAARLEAVLSAGRISEQFAAELRTLDADLKQRGINPGTTADLIVATLFAWRLERDLGAAERRLTMTRPRQSNGAPANARY